MNNTKDSWQNVDSRDVRMLNMEDLEIVAGGTGISHYTECPACGSKNIRIQKTEGDSKLGYATYYCPDCGYKETHTFGDF